MKYPYLRKHRELILSLISDRCLYQKKIWSGMHMKENPSEEKCYNYPKQVCQVQEPIVVTWKIKLTIRNGCKEGNVSNHNMDDPFKKLQKTTGFFSNWKETLSKFRRSISRNECIKMWSSSSDQQLRVTLIIFNSYPKYL